MKKIRLLLLAVATLTLTAFYSCDNAGKANDEEPAKDTMKVETKAMETTDSTKVEAIDSTEMKKAPKMEENNK